jgi:hypothetical protein
MPVECGLAHQRCKVPENKGNMRSYAIVLILLLRSALLATRQRISGSCPSSPNKDFGRKCRALRADTSRPIFR